MKLGHGGTLDPLATGVLIIGVGSGTKSLTRFLDCTKSYECVVLFGAATDTYDVAGKVVGRAPYAHVTREKVEQALEGFRGKIMQRPPIFSALKMQGKKLYEYAREGKTAPREIEVRPVEVVRLEMVEWMEGGAHGFYWPEEEAPREEKAVAETLLHIGEKTQAQAQTQTRVRDPPDLKRKREGEEKDALDGLVTGASPPPPKKTRASPSADADADADAEPEPEPEPGPFMSGALPPSSSSSAAPPQPTNPHAHRSPSPSQVAQAHTHGPAPRRATAPCPAPAARLRMTVTSGFYVRSLAHDLGGAVGSLGTMAALVRTRQGGFELGRNVLEYEELKKGEDAWGPRVRGMLEEWDGAEGDGEGERRNSSSVSGNDRAGKRVSGEV